MINSYYLIGGILAGMCLLASLMFITSKVHYGLKVAASSAVVALSIYAWTVAVSAFGYAVPGYPPDGTVIVGLDLNERGGTVSFWVMDKGGLRAYVAPYEEYVAKKLKEAQEQAELVGGRMIFHFGHSKDGVPKDDKDVVGGKKGDTNKSNMGTSITSKATPPPVSIDVLPSMPEKN